MDKTEYLKICQRRAYGENVLVEYNGIAYIPIERVEWFDKETKMHISAVVQDLKTRTLIRCPIEKITVKEKLL